MTYTPQSAAEPRVVRAHMFRILVQGKQRSTLVKDDMRPEVLVVVSEGAECVVSGDTVTLNLACLECGQIDNALHKSAALVYEEYCSKKVSCGLADSLWSFQ